MMTAMMKHRDQLALPRDSTIPSAASPQSTESDYDEYFGIERADPQLAEWSHVSVSVTMELLKDLEDSRLSANDKLDIAKGLLIMDAITIERWASAADGGRAHRRARIA
jgi:predicted RNA-binding protein with PUA-like domain